MALNRYTWAHGDEELRSRGEEGWKAVPGSFYRHFHRSIPVGADSAGNNCSAQLMEIATAAASRVSSRVSSTS